MSDRCEFVKGDGAQCKNAPLEGEKYCRIHRAMIEAAEGEAPSPPVSEPEVPGTQSEGADSDDMVRVINKDSTKRRRIRYIGKGTYVIAALGITLTGADYGQEIEVDEAFWERMHTNTEAMKAFEEV